METKRNPFFFGLAKAFDFSQTMHFSVKILSDEEAQKKDWEAVYGDFWKAYNRELNAFKTPVPTH